MYVVLNMAEWLPRGMMINGFPSGGGKYLLGYHATRLSVLGFVLFKIFINGLNNGVKEMFFKTWDEHYSHNSLWFLSVLTSIIFI